MEKNKVSVYKKRFQERCNKYWFYQNESTDGNRELKFSNTNYVVEFRYTLILLKYNLKDVIHFQKTFIQEIEACSELLLMRFLQNQVKPKIL
jgi:hypothetical protein